MTNGKKALITGIQGFTGHYMAAELSAAGYEVYGLGSKVTENNEKYIQVDLTNADQVKIAIDKLSPDVVVHLAAIAFVGHSDPNEFYNVNLSGTRNLLQALADTSIRPQAILIASSANVYGNTTPGKLSETIQVNPANDYAVSKLAMEYMAKLFMDRLPIVITRPFNYTGVGQSDNFLIPKIVKHFRHGCEVIELGNIDVWRDFSDVRYLVKCYAELIESKSFGHTVNVASGKMYSLREIIEMCEEFTSHKIRLKVNPQFVRANEIKELCGDVTLFESLTANKTKKISLRETIKWMLEVKN